jgi:enterochelin esterase family protein
MRFQKLQAALAFPALAASFFFTLLPCTAQTAPTKQSMSAEMPATPQVRPDRRVTFYFPNLGADAVALQLEGHAKPLPMQHDSSGEWSVTVGPLTSSIYEYNFVVNGVSLLDPSNPQIDPNLQEPSNYFEIPSPTPQLWDQQDVPHGIVHHRFYTSKAAGDQRDYYVYTPPGYDPKAHTKYPVLYLLHGYSDDASGWTSVGRANFILDNLIAQGKVQPMIVVMPLGYGVMAFVTGHGADFDSSMRQKSFAIFSKTLLDEIIPQVETQYHVSRRAQDRAIAGLSMGGGQSLLIGLNHPKTFDWVGAFSAGGYGPDFDAQFPTLNAKTAQQRRLLWIACGKDDIYVTKTPLITLTRQFVFWLHSKDVPVTFVETPGMHQWQVWRDNLIHFAPLLFQPK